MKTCSLTDFMHVLDPWLNSDYIRKACFDDKGNFILLFVDGGGNAYHIDDCTQAQLKDILELLKAKGVPVEQQKAVSKDTLNAAEKKQS